jgi:uncharacterized protein YbjQ (UPF0145 family)
VILSTTYDVAGRQVTETLGLVQGNAVRARHIGRDITAALKNIVGGEVREYAELQAQSREQAAQRMVERAEAMGADAIVGVRFATSMIASGMSEMLAFGTAVKLGA